MHSIHSVQSSATPNIKESTKMATLSNKVITGDDMLIEYTSRMIKVVRLLKDEISYEHKAIIEAFIKHSAWMTTDLKETVPDSSLWQRLEARKMEMNDRRRRLAKNIAKQNFNIKNFERIYDKTIETKDKLLKQIDNTKLEKLLLASSKNIAHELVSILWDTTEEKGVLNILERKRLRYFSNLIKDK